MSVRRSKGIALLLFVVRPENLEKHAETARRLFGCNFERMHGPTVVGPDDPKHGLDMYIDFDTGIELVAPLDLNNAHFAKMAKFLEEEGEGLWAIVYRVDDLEGAAEKAKAAGRPVGGLILQADDDERRQYVASYSKRITDIQEIGVGPFIGLEVLLTDIAYVD